MSYDPQSGGNTEPTGGSEPTQPTGGQPTMPTGGYTPPPGEGYTPPPSPQGGYTPPPQGGYTPPPQGGYNAPPPPQGGSYGPPPGYNAPPPPPPPSSGGPTFNMGNMGSVSQADMQGLVQKYINVITKPNVGVYESEIPQANWRTVIIGVVAVAVIGAIFALLRGLLFPVSLSTYGLGNSAATSAMTSVAAATGVSGAIFTLFLSPILFFAGSGIIFMMGRLFGGTGSDYMTNSYLLSLSYTPLKIIGALLGIIPGVGGFITLAALLYQLYHAGLSLQASQRMQPGRAQLAAFLPLMVGAVVLCLCVVFAVLTGAALLGNALSNP